MPMNVRARTSLWAIGLTGVLVVLKFGLYALSGSLAVLAESWHCLGDVATTVLVFLVVLRGNAGRPAGANRRFHPERVVSFGIGFFLLVVSAGILRRVLMGGTGEVQQPLLTGFVFMGLSFGSFFLYRFERGVGEAEGSAALVADSCHQKADFYSAFLTGASLLVYRLFDFRSIDRWMGLFIALFIFANAVEMLVNVWIMQRRKSGRYVLEYRSHQIFLALFKGATYRAGIRFVEEVTRVRIVGSAFSRVARRGLSFGRWAAPALLVAWYLSTCLFAVGVGEAGFVERFGRPLGGGLVGPGLHLKFPWPVDRAVTVDTGLIRSVNLGNIARPALLLDEDIPGDWTPFIEAILLEERTAAEFKAWEESFAGEKEPDREMNPDGWKSWRARLDDHAQVRKILAQARWSPGKRIFDLLPEEIRRICRWMVEGEADSGGFETFLRSFNEQVIMNPRFYDRRYFREVALADETASRLRSRNPASLTLEEAMYLNRRLVEASFPKVIRVRKIIDPYQYPLIWTLPHGADEQFLSGDRYFLNPYVTIHWRVKDPFLFRYRQTDPVGLIEHAGLQALTAVFAERAYAQVAVGDRRFREEGTGSLIEDGTRRRLQGRLDLMESGIEIVGVSYKDVHPPRQVAAAFEDVVSAEQDKLRSVNMAEAARDDMEAGARCDRERMVKEAEAVRVETRSRAEHQTARFTMRRDAWEEARATGILSLHVFDIADWEGLCGRLASPAGGDPGRQWALDALGEGVIDAARGYGAADDTARETIRKDIMGALNGMIADPALDACRPEAWWPPDAAEAAARLAEIAAAITEREKTSAGNDPGRVAEAAGLERKRTSESQRLGRRLLASVFPDDIPGPTPYDLSWKYHVEAMEENLGNCFLVDPRVGLPAMYLDFGAPSAGFDEEGPGQEFGG